MFSNFIIVAAGGGLGAMLRYGISMLMKNTGFPVATLLINIAGSFVIGIVMAMSVRTVAPLNETTKLILATGICGGFTTFSAFSYENLALLQSGRFYIALIYIMASVLLGILAAWAGFKMINT